VPDEEKLVVERGELSPGRVGVDPVDDERWVGTAVGTVDHETGGRRERSAGVVTGDRVRTVEVRVVVAAGVEQQDGDESSGRREWPGYRNRNRLVTARRKAVTHTGDRDVTRVGLPIGSDQRDDAVGRSRDRHPDRLLVDTLVGEVESRRGVWRVHVGSDAREPLSTR
jgi:hypothetical protein